MSRTWLLLPLWLLACVDGTDDDTDTDATGETDDTDDTDGEDTDVDCVLGASTEAVIGAAGGTLSLCGGSVTVPADVLTEDTTFGIEVVTVDPPEAPYELAGLALRFTPDDAPLPGRVGLALPHDGDTGILHLYVDTPDGLIGIEACATDATTITQELGLLGTFVAVRDPTDYPEGPTGLGEGTVTGTLGEDAVSWTLPGEGWTIDEGYGDALGLTVTVEPDGETYTRLKLVFVIDEADEVIVIDGSWFDGTDLWQLGEPASGEPLATVSDATAGADSVTATVVGTLHSGENTLALDVDVDVEAPFWRYPPERVCGVIEG